MTARRFPAAAISTICLLLLIVSMLESCSTAGDEIPGFRRFEENGVVVAETDPGSEYPPPVFRFEPIVTMKEDPSREESLLSRPSALFSVGPDGRYYVPDDRANDIAVFDPEGTFIKRFGREGDGPGEFRSTRLQHIGEDGISIFDFHLQRTSRFRLDGSLIDVVRPPINALLIDMERGPGGTLLLHGVSSREDDNVGYTNRSVLIVTAEEDTIAEVSTNYVKENMLSRIEVLPGQFSTLSQDIPYAGMPSTLHLPGRGILATDGDKPELTWYDYDGRVTMIIRIGLETKPITAGVRSRFEERRRQARLERARERGTTPQPLPDYPYPDHCGFFGWGTVDDEGWTWLSDVWASYEEPEEDGYTFHVINAEGRYLGTAELPAERFNIAYGRLMCVVDDPATGARVPTVFRIVPNVERLKYP